VHDDYLPKVKAAQNMAEARSAMSGMIVQVHMTHFGLIPDDVYDSFDAKSAAHIGPEGQPGLEVRVVNGAALVTSVEPGSPAAAQHVQMGWEVRAIDGQALSPLFTKISAEFSKSTLEPMMLTRIVEARLNGNLAKPARITFVGAHGQQVEKDIARAVPRGELAQFGNLPPMHVWSESRRIADAGYFGFNVFLDPARIISEFEKAVRSCTDCKGFIVDLRGNPGGIGVMAMGMAGFFIEKADERLGTMQMRNLALKFVINPRPPIFAGPVAVLVDGLSASTSEIFAGGLQDLHRARVFGTRTAGAALPSMIERLPNGDAFQYAVANYISEGGTTLEGHGVQPDEVVPYHRTSLAEGHDAALDAALAWIHHQK
jgi:carboxyl-terminal processing protease